MDYEIITVSSYDGKRGKEKAIEVFHTATGNAICVVRRCPREAMEAWLARAFERAVSA